MRVDQLIACPICRQAMGQDPEGFSCNHCGKRYPKIRDVLDFRHPVLDETDRFSLVEDNLIASKLDAAFAQACGYHQLRKLFEVLWQRRARGEDITQADPLALLLAQPSRPISDGDLMRGRLAYEMVERFRRDRGRGLPSHQLALEAGAGYCLAFEALTSHFEQVVVVDISLSRLILGRKAADEIGLRDVIFLCGNVERLPLLRGNFDLVRSDNVIEHLEDQGKMVAEAKRVLRPGGMLSIRSRNPFSFGRESHSRWRGLGILPQSAARGYRRVGRVAPLSHKDLLGLARASFGRQVFIGARPRYSINPAEVGPALRPTRLSRRFGRLRHRMINRVMLGVMPVHWALCFKGWAGPRVVLASSGVTEGGQPEGAGGVTTEQLEGCSAD